MGLRLEPSAPYNRYVRQGKGGRMPKVSVKEFQRRIVDLDARYTVGQPKRSGRVLRSSLALLVLALIAVAAMAAHRTAPELTRLTLKQGPVTPKSRLSDAEAQARWNAVWGAATRRGE